MLGSFQQKLLKNSFAFCDFSTYFSADFQRVVHRRDTGSILWKLSPNLLVVGHFQNLLTKTEIQSFTTQPCTSGGRKKIPKIYHSHSTLKSYKNLIGTLCVQKKSWNWLKWTEPL